MHIDQNIAIVLFPLSLINTVLRYSAEKVSPTTVQGQEALSLTKIIIL